MNQMPKSSIPKSMLIWVALTMFAFTLVLFNSTQSSLMKQINFNEFIDKVKKNEVVSVTYSGNEIVGTLKAKGGEKAETFKTFGDTKSDYFLDILGKNNLVPNYAPEDTSGSFWMNLFSSLFPILLIMGVLYFVMRGIKNNQGGMAKFGSLNLANIQNSSKVKFSDVVGMDEAKEELTEIVDFLKNPAKYTDLGGKIPKGALLIGPPGTGKTMIAKATANEAGVPFFSLSGSNFIEMFVGVGASRVRDLFDQARKNAPSIIFIDEIDAMAKQRSGSQFGSNSEMDQTLNQLLVEMDGIDEKNKQIIVLAATNRPDILDQALLRPGRFDRRVNITLPDINGRTHILESHARNKKISPNVDFKNIAKGTGGMSGADLENLLNEAAILSARRNLPEIDMKVIEDAKDKILMGTERRSIIQSDQEKKTTAYHEAGHAIVSKVLKLHTVHKVTIVPRGRALGVTQITPDDDQVSFSKDKAISYICMLMGGRAAESVEFNHFTTGASDDIKRATDIARKMVTEWGMSDVFGPMNLVHQGSSMDSETISPDTKNRIDQEIQSILTSCYEKTKILLTEHKSLLDAVSNLLIQKETISGDDINQLYKS